MIISEFRTDVPDWVKNNWLTRCPQCGAYIADNSDTGSTTARWCTNKSCPEHMSHKIKVMADYFKIAGMGPATAKRNIIGYDMKSPFEFIPLWFGEVKPIVNLSDIAYLACIEGYGKIQAVNDLSPYCSFEQYFMLAYDISPKLLEYKDMLIDAQKYFNIKPPLSLNKIYVMGTGSFHGYSNRDEYFNMLNARYGQYIHVIQTGKRKTGVAYLIKEDDAVDHSKSRIAREYGIPIVSPADFITLIEKAIAYNNEE